MSVSAIQSMRWFIQYFIHDHYWQISSHLFIVLDSLQISV